MAICTLRKRFYNK